MSQKICVVIRGPFQCHFPLFLLSPFSPLYSFSEAKQILHLLSAEQLSMLGAWTSALYPSISSSKYCVLPENNSSGRKKKCIYSIVEKSLSWFWEKWVIVWFFFLKQMCLSSNGDRKIWKVSYLESHVNFILLVDEKLL